MKQDSDVNSLCSGELFRRKIARNYSWNNDDITSFWYFDVIHRRIYDDYISNDIVTTKIMLGEQV